MTADVDLLPLPDWQGDFMTESEFREEAQAYARANVAHAAAAKDAEIEALRAEVNRFRALEAEAAEFVEVPIINRTKFTGDEPYVGWRGLGQSLNEALDERDALREQLDWMVEQNDMLLDEGRKLTARAERLAEALRWRVAKWREQAAREKARRCWVTAAQARQCADDIDTLLREQENGDA